MSKKAKKTLANHNIEVSFKNGVYIDGKPTNRIFDETLYNFGFNKDDEIHIKIGKEPVDRAFALEIEELLFKLGFNKVKMIKFIFVPIHFYVRK